MDPIKAILVSSKPTYWHHYLVGKVLDIRRVGVGVQRYQILDTPHNHAILKESDIKNVQKELLYVSARFIQQAANNEELVTLLKGDEDL